MLIRRKLTLVMILLVSLPLLLLSFWIYNFTSQSHIESSQKNILQITDIERDALTAFISEEKKEVELSAERNASVKLLQDEAKYGENSSVFRNEVKGTDSLLKERVNKLPELQHSFIADLKGDIISDSDPIGKTFTVYDRDYFHEALMDKVVISNTLYSKIDGKPIIAIAAPIKDSNGQIIGVFANSIYTDYFEKFISNIKLGNTGYAYIVDNDGILVAHPDKTKMGTYVDNSTVRSIVQKVQNSENPESSTGTYNYNGVDKFMGYSVIPDLKWTLVIAQDVSEINSSARLELYVILIMAFVMILISTVTSIIAAGSITKPIGKIISTMNKAAQGDLTSICDYESKDELGQLSTNFNSMIKKLNSSYQELSAVYEELSATEEELRSQYDELLKSQDALQLSEERYKQALDGVNDAVWEWDLETNKFYASDKWYEITGYSNNNVNIRKLVEVGVLAENKEKMLQEIHDYIQEKTNYYRSEFKIITGLGEIKWILNRGKLIKNSEGKIVKLTGAMTDTTITREAEEKVRKLAYFDELTKLPNRTTFINKLESEIKICKKSNQKCAVLFIDLDDFKKINDSMGHDFGDRLLNSIGSKINNLISRNDMLCRFGGDEFLILKRDFHDKDEIKKLAKSVLKIFENRFDLEEKQIFITCSIGVSLYPDDGDNQSSLLKNADAAMYKAKEKGKNRYKFYSEEMSQGLMKKMVIEKALRNAISNNDLYIHYQPQVEIKTGKIVGTEALIRLNNEEIGFVSPGEFIPVAEKTGLIVPIGEWIMKTACMQNMDWIRKGYDSRRISINVSSIQIYEPDFVENVRKLIRNLGIPAELIELEITESTLMESLEANVEILKELRSIGVRIALDDFGTGYSSLNYLRMIPINTLKIDKSFIDDICFNKTQAAIVDGIIKMAHKMDVEVVAEGIETPEQLEVLRQKKCDIVQGYIYSRPLPKEEIEEILIKGFINQ